MAQGSTCATPTNSSESFSACIVPKTTRAPASAWRSYNASCSGMVGGSGQTELWTMARRFLSPSGDNWTTRIDGRRKAPMTAMDSRPAMRPEMTMEDLSVDILLVEDNPSDVRLTLHALKRHRLTNRIFVVRDGAEALEFLFVTGAYARRTGADRPRVVMLDLKLPRVDGIEVLRAIRSNPGTRTLPVVMLTSSREERDITRTYDLGANSYIVKPVDFEQFTEAVRQLGLYWVLLNQRAPANDL